MPGQAVLGSAWGRSMGLLAASDHSQHDNLHKETRARNAWWRGHSPVSSALVPAAQSRQGAGDVVSAAALYRSC